MVRKTSTIIETIQNSSIKEDLESKLLLASILDHKKHYALCILNTFFYHMLESDIDMKIYNNAKNTCIADIFNFYNFLINNEIREQDHFSDDCLRHFKEEINLPKDTPPTEEKTEGTPAAKKMIIREMDHPMQILFFAGQLIKEDGDTPIDFVVNPLSGAIEIGYAIKSIYAISNINKVKDIFLIKYSKYGEGDKTDSPITSYVPTQLDGEIQKILNKRLLIIDDNVFWGDTLLEIKKICLNYTQNINITAIEKSMSNDEKSRIKYKDMLIKPISKLRFVEKVMDEVINNNLHNLAKK